MANTLFGLIISCIVLQSVLTEDVPHPRISNGYEATPHSAPWQAALLLEQIDGNHIICGGALISRDVILTAAYCVKSARQAEVILGAHNITVLEPTQVRLIAEKFSIHAEYNPVKILHDIGMVHLPQKVDLNEYIQPITLPRIDIDLNQDLLTTTGWGKTSDAGPSSNDVLMTVSMPLLSQDDCNKWLFGHVLETHLCTNSWTGDVGMGKGFCDGDKGGPLTIPHNGEVYLVGINSFVLELSCQWGYPVAYTRVGAYLDWIDQQIDL